MGKCLCMPEMSRDSNPDDGMQNIARQTGAQRFLQLPAVRRVHWAGGFGRFIGLVDLAGSFGTVGLAGSVGSVFDRFGGYHVYMGWHQRSLEVHGIRAIIFIPQKGLSKA